MPHRSRKKTDEDYKKHLRIVRRYFRTEYEKGDRLALLECVCWCADYGIPLPRWALVKLAVASQAYLSGNYVTFHDAIFGAKKPTGRHSNPATKRRETQFHQLLFDVVTSLKRVGFKGDGLYERAHDILEREISIAPDGKISFGNGDRKKVPSSDSIEKTYKRMKTDARPSWIAGFLPNLFDLGAPDTGSRRRGTKV